jgi:hypothetical protein
VKVLHAVRGDERTALAREAARLAQLQDEHIVAVYDADFSSAQPCVVMEYVAGCTLRQWVDRQRDDGPWKPPHNAALVAIQVCAALQQAHARGIVHRDIKPENILLTGTGNGHRVKVTDFGLARRVDAPGSDLSGTPGYISPEQLAGAAPDRRADIFSVGVVLYEMLTGHHPFIGSSHAETLWNTLHRHPQVDGPDVREQHRVIVSRALQKRPEDRYASVEALLADLRAADSPRGLAANPFLSEFPQAVRTWLDRHQSGVSVAAVSCVWGCVSLFLSFLTGAACIRVIWKGEGAQTFEMIYGYAVEPNAGPWYFIGASFSFLAVFGLLHAMHMGLARTGTLTAIGPPGEATAALLRIAEINRRYFRVIVPIVVVGATWFVLIPEIVFRDSNAFGWVQADMPARLVGMSYRDLLQTSKIGDVAGVQQLRDARLSQVFNRSADYEPPRRVWLGLFLFSALTHQIVFTTFAVFAALKLLFFFGLLSRALLGSDGRGVRLAPDLDDRHDYRFGLGRLDNVYFAALLCLALGSLGRLAQTMANFNKGTYFFRGNAALPLIGQPMLLLAVFVLLVVLVMTPIIVFMLLTIRAVDHERARLAAMQKELQERLAAVIFRERRAQIQADIEQLTEGRRVIDRQRLLPTAKPLFWWLLAANAMLLLIVPVAVATDTGRDLWRYITNALCAACGNAPHAS